MQLLQEEDNQSNSSYHTTASKPADPVHGECIMFDKTLLMLTTLEPPQRKLLFKTRCLVKGKVCRVIVDSCSTKNLAFTEMIEKLGLEKIPHPTPYKVSWLNKEKQTMVDEQCWVDFDIGKYKDMILCEVTNMDACHLILGRP